MTNKKIRFAAVGAINTVVDFTVLIFFTTLFASPIIVANIISTSVALTVSFVLNKKAVFKDTDQNNRQQVLRFVIVTLSGLWVVQGVVILAVSTLLQNVAGIRPFDALLYAKIAGTLFSLTWNYMWYNHYVFKKQKKN